ncbi:MAG: aminotransferase class I/II-fold pyridoxal phosphate-dependent enzyme, partial [Coleofasciculus sp. C2-GNP5-27]
MAGNEWAYVKDCLDTGWVSSAGRYVERFEADFAKYLGCNHAVSTVNGTAALQLALLATGVAPDDEVLVSTLTFIASANAIRYAGAWPVFIDAESDYWQMDTWLVRDFLQEHCHLVNG